MLGLHFALFAKYKVSTTLLINNWKDYQYLVNYRKVFLTEEACSHGGLRARELDQSIGKWLVSFWDPCCHCYYRVFCIEMLEIKGLKGHLKLKFKLWKIHWQLIFDLWPFNLVESNIIVLHSLSSEGRQNFNWNSVILFKKKNQKIKLRWF